jgi:hypothetical protein
MNESANFNQEESKEGMVNRSEFTLKPAMAGVGRAMTGSVLRNTLIDLKLKI